MRTLHASLIPETNKLDTAHAYLQLVEVDIAPGNTQYLAPNPANVVFAGQMFTAFPLIINSMKSDSQGGLAELEIQISNVTRAMSAFVEANELRGNRVRLIGVHTNNLDDATKTLFDEEYEIHGYTVTQQMVSFQMGHQRLIQQRFPTRRALRDNCQWRYKSSQCGFVDNTHLGWGTVSSSGVTITGTDTKFTKTFKAGDSITAASQARVVNVVTNDTSMTVTVAPSPVWSGATYTITKPTCSQILGGDNGCRAHFGVTGPGRFGGFPGMPTVAGRLVG